MPMDFLEAYLAAADAMGCAKDGRSRRAKTARLARNPTTAEVSHDPD
ncbi:MAG TPA: hypothetical protein VF231_07775 [Candidatus Limnocylindrales bacterium]